MTSSDRISRTAASYAPLILALIQMACGSADDVPGTDPGDRPIALDPGSVRVVGTAEAMADVRDLEVLPDGGASESHGRLGDGPEEVGAPFGLVVNAPDGEAWVFDRRAHSLVRISRPAEPWREIRLPRDVLPLGTSYAGRGPMAAATRLPVVGGEVYVPRSMARMEDGFQVFWLSIWGADLVGVDLDTGQGTERLSLAAALGDPEEHVDLPGDFPPFPLWYRLLASCGGESLALYDRIGNQIRHLASGGTEAPATPLPAARQGLSQEEFGRAVFPLILAEQSGAVGLETTSVDTARIMSRIAERAQGNARQLQSSLPRYTDMLCDEDDRVWIQPADFEGIGLPPHPRWLRVDGDGTITEIHLPDRFDLYRIRDGRLWGIQRDDFDVGSVAWIAAPG
jgi:hypothetical protein